MTVIPTITDIARKAVSLAEERPDYIYERAEGGACQYIADCEAGVPGCIFGHALVALGVKPTSIPEYVTIGGALGSLINRGHVRPTDPDASDCGEGYHSLINAMRRVQVAQDKGKPWGEAIQPLRKFLPELTLEDLAKRMVELAEDQPERKYIRPDGDAYGACYYVHGDGSTERFGGGCIVGQALVSLGVSPQRMTGPARGTASFLTRPNHGDVPLAGEEALRFVITEAQGLQDQNNPWGEAIAPVVAYFEQVGK